MTIKHVSKSEFEAKALKYSRQVESSGKRLIVTDQDKPALPHQHECRRDPLDVLRGSVLRYEDPMEPIGEDDWKAGQ